MQRMHLFAVQAQRDVRARARHKLVAQPPRGVHQRHLVRRRALQAATLISIPSFRAMLVWIYQGQKSPGHATCKRNVVWQRALRATAHGSPETD